MSVAFAPNGKNLASGGLDDTIKLWNVAGGQEIKSFAEPNGMIISVAFSPDGKTVASGSDDRTIKLRDIETGQKILTLRGHSSAILSVAFSPDGRRLASGDFIVYLSGHGTAITSAEAVKESAFPDMYLYATRDATTLDRAIMVNQSERTSKTVNSLELAKWVSEIKADKKVMIFDTCAAGAAQKDLTSQTRAVDALQVRSIDRLRELTGFYILMGSAADAVSYEANEFRQGLLTYSLIEAMTTNKGLRDGKFLDVEKWFASAEDKVENLAKGIGGVQRPSFFKSNFAKTFDIGRVEREEQLLLPLAQRVPLILQPELREAGKFTDKERLTEKLETRLLEQSP